MTEPQDNGPAPVPHELDGSVVGWIRDDLTACFVEGNQPFTSGDDVGPPEVGTPMYREYEGGRIQACASWEWTLKHTKLFAGAYPTNRMVVIQGMTIFDVIDGNHVRDSWARYIDWVTVFAQIGILPGRQAIGDPTRSPTAEDVLSEYAVDVEVARRIRDPIDIRR